VMEAAIIVGCLSMVSSLACATLVYRSQSEQRAEARREKKAAAKAERDAEREDDTTTFRIRRLESADEFREELLKLWRESRDGWARCESERIADKAEAHAERVKDRGEIHSLRNELDQLRRSLGEALRPSLPPGHPT